jgi:hypothetical protein
METVMFRRRRRHREIPFSFDSFLDVVANVVGIIIRLILVAWVGARSYNSVQELLKEKRAQAAAALPSSLPADPLELELTLHRKELADAQARLLEQLRQLGDVKGQHQQKQLQLTGLLNRRQGIEKENASLERILAGRKANQETQALTLAEINPRRQRLIEEIQALEKQPPLRHTLHYRTPVSRPVLAEELMFECRGSRTAFVDLAGMVQEIKLGMESKSQLLRTQWQVADVTRPIGAFRLRYTIERHRGTMDALTSSSSPAGDSGFSYGLGEWQVEAIAAVRGETASEALAPHSQFRQIVDVLDPQQAVVTFWIYPDSFTLFRQLRDYLYDHELEVAGRPLPEGIPISGSRHGTVSRGQ